MKTDNLKLITNNYEGQSLFEVVVALLVVSLIIVALVNLAAVSIRNVDFSRNQTRANLYVQEGNEWLRGQRDAGWTAFSQKALTPVWCLPTLSWSSAVAGNCSSANVISGTFYRREVAFTIVDATNIQVGVNVYWDDGKGRHEVRSVTNLTNWNAQ